MNRTLAIVLAVAVLCSGAVATAAAFTDGDEVAPDSEVYLDAADSDNGERYVQIDESDEVRIKFDTLPPGSQTQVNDLFVVGFGGYEDSDAGTTVRLESNDDRVTLERMDTGETFADGTIELQPGESVLFGAVVSTDGAGFSSTIELDVDVPDTDTGGGSGGGDGGGQAGGGGGVDTGDDDNGSSDGEADGSGDDELTDGEGDTPDGPTEDSEGSQSGADDADDDTEAGSDATDPSVDPDADPGSGLIELAGFGNPFSLIAMSVIAAMLSLSYVYRVRIATSAFRRNTEKN